MTPPRLSLASLVVGLAIAAGAGCYDPRIEDGTLRCAGDRCPRGFGCWDGRCWRHPDGAADGAGRDGARGAGGMVGPLDASSPEVTFSDGAADRADGPPSGAGGMGAGGVGAGGAGGTVVGGTGGLPGSGGRGGMTGTGGAPGTGGARGTGGVPAGTGGVRGTGGAPGTGGVRGTGGAPGVGGMPAGTGGAMEVGLPLGASCNVGSDCHSTFCTDHVCCNEACGSQCQACDIGTDGICRTVTSGPPHGTIRDACPGSPDCRSQCDGTSATQCGPAPAGKSCQCLVSLSLGTCNSDGRCQTVLGGIINVCD